MNNSEEREVLIKSLIVNGDVICNYKDILAAAQNEYIDYCLRNPNIEIFDCYMFAKKIENDFIDLLVESYAILFFIEKDIKELEMAVVLLSTNIDIVYEEDRKFFEMKKSQLLFSPFFRSFKQFNVSQDRLFQEKVKGMVKKACEEVTLKSVG